MIAVGLLPSVFVTVYLPRIVSSYPVFILLFQITSPLCFPLHIPVPDSFACLSISCLPVVLDPCSVLDDPASPSPKQTFRPTTTQPAQAPTQRLSPTTNKPRPLWIDAWICTPQLLTTPPGHTHVILSHSLHFIFRVGPHLTDFINKDFPCVLATLFLTVPWFLSEHNRYNVTLTVGNTTPTSYQQCWTDHISYRENPWWAARGRCAAETF